MRVIAGIHRGRRLIGPEGDETRPITDRVKQSLFDRLASAGVIEGAAVLDVFAGTGSMGIECLSRGAVHATFVEKSRDPRALLEKNLELLGERERSRVIGGNALSAGLVDVLPRRDYGLIFLDPPYPLVADESRAERLWSVAAKLASVSAPGAWLVLRTAREQPAPALDVFGEPDSTGYGSMAVHIYGRAGSRG